MERLDSRAICYGLTRLVGAGGFGIAVVMVFFVAHSAFGVSFENTSSFNDLSRRQIVVAVVATVAGLLGLLIGQGIGASMPVRNDRTSELIDSLWHISANTVIVWIPAAGLLLGLAMGREAMAAFWQSQGLLEMIWLWCLLPMTAGLVMASLLWFALQVLPDFGGGPVVLVLSRLSPLVVFGLGGIHAASRLGLAYAWGLPLALLPIVILPLSAQTMKKDRDRRVGS